MPNHRIGIITEKCYHLLFKINKRGSALRNRKIWNQYVQVLSAFMLMILFSSSSITAQVKVAWEDVYSSGVGEDSDAGQVITMDSDGFIYVAGYAASESKRNLIVIKYNSEGEEVWTSRLDSYPWYFVSDIKVDLNGNIYVASQADAKYHVAKLRANGQLIWQTPFTTTLGHAKSIVLHYENNTGEDPNIVVTGWIFSGSKSYTRTTKYNTAGSVLWTKYYDLGGSANEPNSMVSIGTGYLVAGFAVNANGNSDYLTIRYDRDGNEVWVKKYDGSAGGADVASDVSVNTLTGGTYRIAVTGYSRGTGGIDDCTTVLYDQDGNQQWDARYYDSNNLEKDNPNSYCNSVSASFGTITVASRSGDDIATINYDFEGNQLWDQRYNGPGNGLDIGFQVLKDFEGSVYVLGRSEGESVNEYTVIKYNSSGVQVWLQKYGAAEGGAVPGITGMAIERSSGRKIYVTGGTNSGSGNIGTIVYSDEGPDWANLQWPPTAEINEGGEYTVYGQAWLAYLGESPSKDDYLGEMLAWVGVNTQNSDPSTWDESAWKTADFNEMKGSNAEYMLDIGSSLSPDTYFYATRFAIFYPVDNGQGSGSSSADIFSYGGYSENGGGFWDGVNNVSGTLTVNKDSEDLNLANNNSFQYFDLGEVVEGGANAWSFNIIANGANAMFEVIEDAQDDDLRSLKVVNGAFNGNEEWNVEAVSEGLPVKEGVTYQASVWLKADTDSRVALIYLGLPESGGWARPVEKDVTLTTEWTKYTVSHTATANDESNTARLGIAMNYSENANGIIYIDNVEVLDAASIVSNEEDGIQPISFKLEQNYPNPFNPSTQISYQLPVNSLVSLKVFDMLGREVANLLNEPKSAGSHTVNFDATGLSSGIYIYRLQAGKFIETNKMMLIK